MAHTWARYRRKGLFIDATNTSEKNSNFWDELCGKRLVSYPAMAGGSPASLKRVVVGMTIPRFRIQCGNSLALMRSLESASIDCVITDPPYSGFEFTGKSSHYRHALLPYLNEIKRCVRDQRIAVSQPEGHIDQVKQELPVSGYAKIDDAFADQRGAAATFLLCNPVSTSDTAAESWRDIPDSSHPNHRDVNKMAAIVKIMSRPGETVLDPFCGSGAIGIACLLLGRNYVGYELDEKRAAEAEQRLETISEVMGINSL